MSIRQKTEALAANRSTHFLMAAFIVAAALLYVYFANAAVRSLAALERTETSVQALSMKVSEMQSRRFTLENSVNAKLASQLGFVEADHPTFIVKNPKPGSLSFKTN